MWLCCYRALHSTLTSPPHLHAWVVRPLLGSGSHPLFWHRRLPLWLSAVFSSTAGFTLIVARFLELLLAGIKNLSLRAHWSFVDSLSCIDSFFSSSSFVFMLAATMRGSFIIHAMIDVPVVAVFVLQSHQTLSRQQHAALPNTPVRRLRCSVLAFSCHLANPTLLST